MPATDLEDMTTLRLRTALAAVALGLVGIGLTGCDDAYIPSEHQRPATYAEAQAALTEKGYPPDSYASLRPIEEDYWCATLTVATTCWILYYDKDGRLPHAWTPPAGEQDRLTAAGEWPTGAVPG